MMNERIRELAERADPDHWHKRWYSGINPRVMDPEIKKFAELIVQECVEVLRMVPYECDGPEFGDEVVYQEAVKKHFGVE